MCHLAGVDTKPDVFFRDSPEGSVTFTGIHRAKGNEAGMVYVINAQDCHAEAGNLASLRNRLFTALTRSKAWIRVLGVGGGMETLKQEYEKLKERNFELKFTYPTQDQRERLRVIHRDIPESHLTLGQYQNCRIPVTAPMMPFRFIDFVLRNFYHTVYARQADALPVWNDSFAESIRPAECDVVHVVVPA